MVGLSSEVASLKIVAHFRGGSSTMLFSKKAWKLEILEIRPIFLLGTQFGGGFKRFRPNRSRSHHGEIRGRGSNWGMAQAGSGRVGLGWAEADLPSFLGAPTLLVREKELRLKNAFLQ